MPTVINGLPAHILLIHAVIVLVPLACAALVLHALWPTARSRLGVVTPALALVALALVPVTTNAGLWLRDHIHASGSLAERINHHADLGDDLLPWVIGVFLLAVVVWVLGRWRDGSAVPLLPARLGAVRAVPSALSVAVAVVSVVVAAITVVELVRIGDSGSQSVWHGVTG